MRMKVAEAFLHHPDQVNYYDALVSLMRENGYINFDHQFFQYHYIDFPYRIHSFFLLTDNEKVVGHIAFRENFISSSKAKSCWAMHALIDKNYRNLSNFVYLVRNAEHYLVSYGYDLILAMPNTSAADVYKRCLSWIDLGYVNFSLSSKVSRGATRDDRIFYFSKSTEWWNWRLKISKEPKLVCQAFSWKDIKVSQLLYVAPFYAEDLSDLDCLMEDKPICTWDHSNYTNRSSWWSCRYMARSLTSNLDKGILDLNNWHVDMIDSDAFSCMQVEIA